MKYYYHPFSPNCRKTSAVLRAVDLDCEWHIVDLPKGEQMSEEFRAINANAMVPALEDDGRVVLESNAIVIYLAEKAESPLWPADRFSQLEVLQWMFWEQSHFMYACGTVFFQRLIKPMLGQETDPQRVDEALAKFRRNAAVLDARLAEGPYLLGADLSLADWAVASHLGIADTIGLPVSEFPSVAAWLSRLDDHDAWRETAPQG